MTRARDLLIDLESNIRADARHGWEQARKRWERPLTERITACRAIGLLRVAEMEPVDDEWLVHFEPSEEDIAFFREDDAVRLSLNDPDGPGWLRAVFLGLTEKGLTVRTGRRLVEPDGWTLDEEHLDLSHDAPEYAGLLKASTTFRNYSTRYCGSFLPMSDEKIPFRKELAHLHEPMSFSKN